MQGQLFDRAKAMMAAIQSLVLSGMSHFTACQQLVPYESIGKGKGKSGNSSNHSVRSNQRAALKKCNQTRHKLACC